VRVSPRTLVGTLLTAGRSRTVRWGFCAAAVALAVWAVASRWHEVVTDLERLDPAWLVLAAVATVLNACTAGLVWRCLLADLGSRVPLTVAARVFFVGQIGKYLPGSVWPVVMQAELGQDHGVPRRTTATATATALLLSAASAVGVVAASAPFVPDVLPEGFAWAVLLLVPLAVMLHPAVLNRVIDRGLGLIGRQPLERWTTARGTLLAAAWAVVSWCAAGVQIWALAVPLGADADAHALALSIGGYALAWAVGFVVVIAPAGAGAREVALAAAMAPVLDRGAVVVLVLVSRLLFTVTDLALAGIGVVCGAGRSAVRRAG
jgi:glycosyltransferase 2 family protein